MIKNKITFLLLPLLSAVTLQANDPVIDDPFGDDLFKGRAGCGIRWGGNGRVAG